MPPILILIAVIPITIFLGRFFCGYICAFGSMQEFLNYLGTKLKIKK
ncbi:4Fe-4S binding protein [Intestinibacter sp.]